MNIAKWLYDSAKRQPDAPAIFSGIKQQANYHQFACQAYELSKLLEKEFKIKSGDNIALYMPNSTHYLIVMYAAWWLGAVIVPINYKLHSKEAAWIIENSASKLVFTDTGDVFATTELHESCAEVSIEQTVVPITLESGINNFEQPKVLSSDNLAWLFYTSGTTGRPKGVMLTHANLVSMSLCYSMDVDHVCNDDTSLYAAPMSHGAGLYNIIFVRVAAKHVVPESRGFDGKEILDLASHHRNLTMFAAPTMIKRMVAQARTYDLDGDGIKTIVFGGGPMYAADLLEAIDVLGPKFAQIYGQGESPMTITAASKYLINQNDHPNWHSRLASVGIAQSSIEIRIVDADLNNLPTGESGEIIVKGPSVMGGYWNNPQATKQTIVDGWLRTGDIGYLSEDGFLTLTDRSKDVIISGGTNIYPREVEEVIAQNPKVFEVAVVGAPNDEWGEEVVGFVVVKPNETIAESELDQWCKDNMASFKKPRRYVFSNELPKNSYGKVLKTDLRAQLKQS